MENRRNFHEKLRETIDLFVHGVYDHTSSFPKEELFGATSQLRRSALSVMLNYIEGYAQNRSVAAHKNFLSIAYGSLRESRYLLEFSFKRNFLSEAGFKKLHTLNESIGAMLWGILSKIFDIFNNWQAKENAFPSGKLLAYDAFVRSIAFGVGRLQEQDFAFKCRGWVFRRLRVGNFGRDRLNARQYRHTYQTYTKPRR
jgi:four helix bundle protein